jgi:hypothetical protein
VTVSRRGPAPASGSLRIIGSGKPRPEFGNPR